MTLVVLLLLSQTPPPLVESDVPPPMPPPRPVAAATNAARPAVNGPLWEAGVWATATAPTALQGSAFMFGLRAELDVSLIGAVATFDRVGVTPLTLGDVRAWTGLLGYSLVSTQFFRVRALAGSSALTGDTTPTQFAPTIGATARALWRFIGAEGSATLTAGTFRQLDLRAAAILRGGIFDVQLGVRARWIDATTDGTLSTLLSASTASVDALVATAPSAPAVIAGPHVSLGLVF